MVMVYIFTSLEFSCNNTTIVEVKLLVQLCEGFINEQIEVNVMSKFVAMAMTN